MKPPRRATRDKAPVKLDEEEYYDNTIQTFIKTQTPSGRKISDSESRRNSGASWKKGGSGSRCSSRASRTSWDSLDAGTSGTASSGPKSVNTESCPSSVSGQEFQHTESPVNVSIGPKDESFDGDVSDFIPGDSGRFRVPYYGESATDILLGEGDLGYEPVDLEEAMQSLRKAGGFRKPETDINSKEKGADLYPSANNRWPNLNGRLNNAAGRYGANRINLANLNAMSFDSPSGAQWRNPGVVHPKNSVAPGDVQIPQIVDREVTNVLPKTLMARRHSTASQSSTQMPVHGGGYPGEDSGRMTTRKEKRREMEMENQYRIDPQDFDVFEYPASRDLINLSPMRLDDGDIPPWIGTHHSPNGLDGDRRPSDETPWSAERVQYEWSSRTAMGEHQKKAARYRRVKALQQDEGGESPNVPTEDPQSRFSITSASTGDPGGVWYREHSGIVADNGQGLMPLPFSNLTDQERPAESNGNGHGILFAHSAPAGREVISGPVSEQQLANDFEECFDYDMYRNNI
ncbi:hypothetical protein K432DRAFT_403195 [Lepidopterella palustris CBS 459.81]|uniref:Uncharacterized protein n=1 Tax=Lepidopterella palustris CBS 459.81 TaxID=1314670 RepID=A0A8E2EE61_9PEZI|nr:hypothetical protein K432DRAFT_403195 [Lepidopterella palustris CBS 459.81]